MKNTPLERKAFQVSQIPWPIVVANKTSQELRMLSVSTVTLNCQVTKIVMNSAFY